MSMQSNRFQCRRKDARCLASRLIREYLAQDSKPHLVAYGTRASMTIGFGVRRVLVPLLGHEPGKQDMTSRSPFAQGSELSSFVTENSGEYILGYLGFDLHGWAAPRDWTRPCPAASLLVPSCVVDVSPSSFSVESGEATFLAGATTTLRPCRCATINQVTALDFDIAHDLAFDETLRYAIEWTHRGGGERLTVSRRITPPISVDLIDSLLCSSGGSPLSRAFYAHFPGVEFAGESPELLAHGSSRAFSVHKLSGTYPRSGDKRVDRDLSRRFQRDQKIRREHDSSIHSLQHSLFRIGTVAAAGPTILELPTLRHFVTRLDVRTAPGIKVIDCLHSVFPSGAEPAEEGLRVLASLERAPRGAYYGLVGVVRPDGVFSFSQSLRAVFRDAEGCHVWVGAAVTSDSNPQQEYEETRLKLSDIRLAASSL